MRNRQIKKAAKPLNIEFIPVEFHRATEEEFEMWDQEPCLAQAD